MIELNSKQFLEQNLIKFLEKKGDIFPKYSIPHYEKFFSLYSPIYYFHEEFEDFLFKNKFPKDISKFISGAMMLCCRGSLDNKEINKDLFWTVNPQLKRWDWSMFENSKSNLEKNEIYYELNYPYKKDNHLYPTNKLLKEKYQYDYFEYYLRELL